jgi:hypothetical protein
MKNHTVRRDDMLDIKVEQNNENSFNRGSYNSQKGSPPATSERYKERSRELNKIRRSQVAQNRKIKEMDKKKEDAKVKKELKSDDVDLGYEDPFFDLFFGLGKLF